jgi:hypothetical protein
VTAWTWGWIAWGAWFAVEEGVALWRVGKRGTLSYFIWTLFGTRGGLRPSRSPWVWTRRGVLAVAMAWLVAHFLSGGMLP